MTQKNTLLVAAYEALKEAQHTLSGLEAIIVGMEDDLNAVEALTAKIEALQATVEGLEARIAAECKHSEEVWVEAQTWRDEAVRLGKRVIEAGDRPAMSIKLLGLLEQELLDGDGDA